MLASRNPYYHITVAAKNMPGDYDIEYASPWAGAHYNPLVIYCLCDLGRDDDRYRS